MTLHGKKYSGTLYGRKYGSNEPLQKLGNLSELTTKREIETNELTSTGRDDYGEAIEIESMPKPTELTLKFNTFDKLAVARALMGEAVDLSTSPTTFSDKSLKASPAGWMKLEFDDIDPVHFSMKNKSSQPIEAEKYELNPRLGMVRLLDSAGINEGDNLSYSGKTKGTAGYQVEANTLQSLPLELYLDGKDRITGKSGTLTIPHAVLASDGDINWLSDDWWENGLSGKIVKDEGKPTMLFKEFN